MTKLEQSIRETLDLLEKKAANYKEDGDMYDRGAKNAFTLAINCIKCDLRLWGEQNGDNK